MEVFYSVETTETEGPRLSIDCPKCGGVGVDADSYERRERLNVFFVLPLVSMTNTFVKCSACRARLLSNIPLDDFDQFSDEEISDSLDAQVSLVVKALAIISVIVFMFPIVGLLIPLSALGLSFKSGGWPKKLAIAGLILSSLMHLVFLVVLLKDL